MLNENIHKAVETMWLKDKLSIYDVGKLLSLVGEAIKNTEKAIINPVDSAKFDVDSIIASARKILSETQQVYTEIDAEANNLVEFGNKLYDKVNKAVELYKIKLHNIGFEQNTMDISNIIHKLDLLVSFAERCDKLTDEQWNRVIDLAKALK
jgi:hypothetical protein